MGAVQLRRYEIKPGEMDAFLASWRGAVVVRRQYGFSAVFALVDEEHNEFVWAITHDGDFPVAEKAYYASPGRAALPADPRSFIDAFHVTMARPEPLPG
jgi:hypothetical protein